MTRPSTATPPRGTAIEQVAGLLLALLTVWVAVKFSYLHPDAHNDGIIFTPALDVARGFAPYRDTFSQYGPLAVWLQALAIKLGGASILSLRLQTSILYGLSAYISFFIWRRLLPLPLAFASGLACLASAHYWTTWMHPWPSVFGNFFSLLSLWAMMAYHSRRGRLLPLTAGIMAAAALWCRQPAGALLFCAGLAYFLFLALTRSAARQRDPAAPAWYAAGFVAACLALILPLWTAGALSDMWKQAVIFPLADISAGGRLPELFQTLFSTAGSALPAGLLWILLPLTSCLILFREAAAPWLKKTQPRPEVIAAALVAAASWGQYYPRAELSHIYWGAAAMFWTPAFLAWELAAPFSRRGRLALAAAAMLLIFGFPAIQNLTSGIAKLKSAGNLATITSPDCLGGMKTYHRKSAFYQAVAWGINRALQESPGSPLINLTEDALYSSFAPEAAYALRPFTLQWPRMRKVYPGYPAARESVLTASRPVVISEKNPVIRDGYSLRTFAWDKEPGRAQLVYVTSPGNALRPWYITDIKLIGSEPGLLALVVTMRFSARHPLELKSLKLTLKDGRGRTILAMKPASRIGDSIVFSVDGNFPSPIPPPPSGRVDLSFGCPGIACMNAETLEAASVSESGQVFTDAVYFLAPAELLQPGSFSTWSRPAP